MRGAVKVLPVLMLAALPVLPLMAQQGAANDDIDVRAWLTRMNTAIEQLNYRGTFVHVVAGEAELMELIHRVQDGMVSERLISLDDSGREVLRTPTETRCVLSAEQSVLVDRQPGASPLRVALPDPSGLEGLYRFRAGKRDRVAGRDTQVISVRPTDQFRYGYRLWLDVETAMPLQAMMLNARSAIVEQIKFTQISFPESIAMADLRPRINVEGFKVVENMPSAETVPLPRNSWAAGDVPQGFELSVAERHDDLPGGEHLVYSDGLASISVFVEPLAKGQQAKSGSAKLGGSNAYSTTKDGHQVIVVGEVPENTLKRIGESMHSLSPRR